jgi:hypothetical protein
MTCGVTCTAGPPVSGSNIWGILRDESVQRGGWPVGATPSFKETDRIHTGRLNCGSRTTGQVTSRKAAEMAKSWTCEPNYTCQTRFHTHGRASNQGQA